jgi:hypothetical protein
MLKATRAILCLGTSILALGCSAGGGSSSNPTPVPVDENQVFELGLKGEPQFSSGTYSGDLSLEFSYDGKTSTNPAGRLEVGFSRSGDQLTVSYAVYSQPGDMSPTTAQSFPMTMVGNTLYKAGQNIGQVGGFSMAIKDENWTYKFLKAVSVEDNKTPMLKVTARREGGGQVATYKGLLKLK